MNEHKSPQDFLNEIFEKSQAATPPVPPPQFEPPGDDPPTPPPGEPTEKHGADGGAKLLPWLGVMLGAALLVLGVCLFQLVRMGHRLDGLQQAVEAVQSVDDLRRENERLQEQLDQVELENSHLLPELENLLQERNTLAIRKWRSDYLFYIRQFMDNGDYPMAALVVVLSAHRYFSDEIIFGEPQTAYLNPEHKEQYQAYCQELADKGYLKLTLSAPHHSTLTVPTFPEQWDPEQNPDMAALGILWCALDECYVVGVPEIAAQYLLNYQWYALYAPGELDGPRYPQRIMDAASEYTIQQYQRLIHDLIESGWLAETDGILYYKEDQGIPDVLYNLPFDPPGGYLYGEIPLPGNVIPGDLVPGD